MPSFHQGDLDENKGSGDWKYGGYLSTREYYGKIVLPWIFFKNADWENYAACELLFEPLFGGNDPNNFITTGIYSIHDGAGNADVLFEQDKVLDNGCRILKWTGIIPTARQFAQTLDGSARLAWSICGYKIIPGIDYTQIYVSSSWTLPVVTRVKTK